MKITEYTETGARQFHMCLSIDGALRWPNRMLAKLLKDDNGNPVTATYARDYLRLLQAKGAKVMKMDDCDNFDDQKGCLGHPTPKEG